MDCNKIYIKLPSNVLVKKYVSATESLFVLISQMYSVKKPLKIKSKIQN